MMGLLLLACILFFIWGCATAHPYDGFGGPVDPDQCAGGLGCKNCKHDPDADDYKMKDPK